MSLALVGHPGRPGPLKHRLPVALAPVLLQGASRWIESAARLCLVTNQAVPALQCSTGNPPSPLDARRSTTPHHTRLVATLTRNRRARPNWFWHGEASQQPSEQQMGLMSDKGKWQEREKASQSDSWRGRMWRELGP